MVGKANETQKTAFGVYHEAMEAGIAAVKPGVTAADVARAENDVFRRHGLGDYVTNKYTRVRGHGLGLICDLKPNILEDVDIELRPGMALIVHPNTYHPEIGYMVLGDVVVVTETGHERLDQHAGATVRNAGVTMRRGLIAWSRTELPESVLDGRVARAQAAMADAKIDALAVYSDPSRSAGASWLTAFVPYWNRGILIVPRIRTADVAHRNVEPRAWLDQDAMPILPRSFIRPTSAATSRNICGENDACRRHRGSRSSPLYPVPSPTASPAAAPR